jgi:hypothetical protein
MLLSTYSPKLLLCILPRPHIYFTRYFQRCYSATSAVPIRAWVSKLSRMQKREVMLSGDPSTWIKHVPEMLIKWVYTPNDSRICNKKRNEKMHNRRRRMALMYDFVSCYS